MLPFNLFAEKMIADKLRNTGACLLDELALSLPDLTWTTIFTTIDRMSQDGRVVLNQVEYTYQVLPSIRLAQPRVPIPPVIVGVPNKSADMTATVFHNDCRRNVHAFR